MRKCGGRWVVVTDKERAATFIPWPGCSESLRISGAIQQQPHEAVHMHQPVPAPPLKSIPAWFSPPRTYPIRYSIPTLTMKYPTPLPINKTFFPSYYYHSLFAPLRTLNSFLVKIDSILFCNPSIPATLGPSFSSSYSSQSEFFPLLIRVIPNL